MHIACTLQVILLLLFSTLMLPTTLLSSFRALNKNGTIVLKCEDEDAVITCSWSVNDGESEPEVSGATGLTVPIDTTRVGKHVLTAHASRAGFENSDDITVEVNVRELPPPRVVSIDRNVGVVINPLRDGDDARCVTSPLLVPIANLT